MLFTLALTLSQIVSAMASTGAPKALRLVVPPKEISVSSNYTIGVSLGDSTTLDVYSGVQANVATSIVYPNGTTGTPNPLQVTTDPRYPCLIDAGFTTYQTYNATQEGAYTVFWNITYATDGNISQDTNTSCTSGNVTTQSWTLNYTFQAIANQTGLATDVAGSAPTLTLPTQLPSAPTAQVNLQSTGEGAIVRESLLLCVFLVASIFTFL